MVAPLRLMAVLAHPDDECLACGGTLAKYATEGVEVHLVTATRGERGRFRGLPPGDGHPGPVALGRIRETELRAAVERLGVRTVSLLGYEDQALDRAAPTEVVGRIVQHVRRVRPQVVLTFPPDGAYGHPDHVAISQFASAAMVAAADAGWNGDGRDLGTHVVSKLYYAAWPAAAFAQYEGAFRRLVSHVDGVERRTTPWPDWSITTVIDARAHWKAVWSAVSCHESQVGTYEIPARYTPEQHEALWGWQSYYRAFSMVNGGRTRETDLFAGLREEIGSHVKETHS